MATVLSHTGAFANALAIVGKFQVKPAIEGLPTSKLSSNAAWIFVDLRGSLWIFVDLGWWIFSIFADILDMDSRIHFVIFTCGQA